MSGIASLKSRVISTPLLKPVLNKVNRARCQSWDLIHGVDTCGEIPIVGMAFQSKNKAAGLEYQSHHPAVIRLGLTSLPIRHEDYTFIDVGCGKGRVLLVASEFPFRTIIGLEFAPPLAEIAKRNLHSYRFGHQRCSKITVVTGDALEYELEPEPQVLYFYSPFSPIVLDQMVQRIEDSFQRFPRDIFVLFSGAPSVRERAFGSHPRFQSLRRERYMDVYRLGSL